MKYRMLLCLVFSVVGGALGCGFGLASGLIWIEVFHTSCFEGYCGYVVVFHALFGLVLGAAAGVFVGARLGRGAF